MAHTDADASRGGAFGIVSDAPGTCKFKKVLLFGLPPSKSEVEALMKSLEAKEKRLASRQSSQ
ncbi:MAG TPA: hypothetical protein VFZ57_04990 [Thermoanaerobaculia bacterium]|nr:hypothetical protein [Thermoanaerobaculia bacterium]